MAFGDVEEDGLRIEDVKVGSFLGGRRIHIARPIQRRLDLHAWQEMEILIIWLRICQIWKLLSNDHGEMVVICINQTPTVRAARNGKENDVPNRKYTVKYNYCQRCIYKFYFIPPKLKQEKLLYTKK